MARASSWIKIFEAFIRDLRIKSRESAVGETRMDLWGTQRRFLRGLGQGLDDGIRAHYFLKGRQQGITTIALAIDLFWLAVHRDMPGVLVTESESNRDANREKIRAYIESFPEGYFGDDFRIVKGKDNAKFMQFSNGSSFTFLVAGTKKKSISWAEGKGFALAHATEVASYAGNEGLASFEESLAQSNPDRLTIYESTAKGMQNVWYDRWMLGVADPLTRRSHFIGWWAKELNSVARSEPVFAEYGRYPASPEEREKMAMVEKLYDHRVTPEQLAWYRWRKATARGEEISLLEQNQPWTHEDAFVITGHSFFQVRKLSKDLKHIYESGDEQYLYQAFVYDLTDSFFTMKLRSVEPDEIEDGIRVELKVYEEPQKNGRYVIGFDPAYGRTDHKDFHAIEVFRCYADCMVQVAEYAVNDVEVTRASWVLFHLAGAYRDCILNVELGGPGRMVLQEFDNLRAQINSPIHGGDPRTDDWRDAMGLARWYLFHRADSIGKGYMNCFETNWRTKQELMHQFRDIYVTNQIIIRSPKLLTEMQNVRVDGSDIGAPESRSEDLKDDRVFATALANRAWLNWRRPEMLAEGLTRERVSDEEQGKIHLVTQRVNNVVYRFLKTQEDLAREAEYAPLPTFREKMGFE